MLHPNWQNRALAILLALSLVAPIWVLARRNNAEHANKNVEIVIDYAEIEELASAVGQPISQVLEQFKQKGATSVAVQEDTLADVLASGQGLLVPKVTSPSTPMQDGIEILVTSPRVETRIINQFDRLGYVLKQSNTPTAPQQPMANIAPYGLYILKTPESRMTPLTVDIEHARAVPLGISPAAIEAARAVQMPIVARAVNFPEINGVAINSMMSDLHEKGISTVIFGQEQTLGFRSLLGTTAEALNKNHIYYGSVEFSKQKGDQKLSDLLDSRLIRVHSIPGAEMANLDRPTAIERYSRAVRERNVRMCYVRLFDTAADDAVKVNLDYVNEIAMGLTKAGYRLGPATPITTSPVPNPVVMLLAAAAAIGFMFLMTSLFKSEWYYTTIYTLLACFIAAIIVLAGGIMGRKLVALAAAIIFPTAAIIRAGSGTPAAPKPLGFFSSGTGAIGRLWCSTAITVAGGLIIAALLSEQAFMVKVDQFAGVKLAHVAPMFLALIAFAGAIAWKSDEWPVQRQRLKTNFGKLLSEPVIVWQTVAVMAVLVLLAIAVARSGNDSGVGVSPFELKFRAILDRVLFVRPRTKEFLIGHPILLAGIAAALTGRRRWAIPLIIFGTIGQISVLNTFCHIHTPISETLIRVTSGLVIGTILGLILYAILRPSMTACVEDSKQGDASLPGRRTANKKVESQAASE